MSDPRTTAEWEALLDGAADGPWEVVPHDEPGIMIRTIVHDRHDRTHWVGDICEEGSARLIAAAPEAVAEVVRLRRELEEMRAEALQVSEAYRQNAGFDAEGQLYGSLSLAEEDTAVELARILEGGARE